MKIINIGGIDYTFKYSVEASLYNECTEKTIGFMTGFAGTNNKEGIKQIVSSMADIPQTALTLFYAGLLEIHGSDGDGTVLTKKNAKNLIRDYFDEHKDDETGNFYGLMTMLIECMADDGFFELIGLDKIFAEAEAKAKSPKTPQDHKKKMLKAKVTAN